jgi:hypothetical protein
MTDFLQVRGLASDAVRTVLATWKASRNWVRSVELVDVNEPQHLEINRRDAIFFMRGKHKFDLADLILLIQGAGGRAIHLKLHRRIAPRIEEDLGEWALKQAGKTRSPEARG